MTTSPDLQTFELASRVIPGGQLITARSHLVDRYRAECARIWLPERRAEPGQYTVETGVLTARTTGRHLPQILPKKTGERHLVLRHARP